MNIKEKNTERYGTILLIVAAAFWGISGVCGQYIMQHKGITSSWLVPYRLLFAGLSMVILGIIREGKKFFDIWKHNPKQLILFSCIGMTLMQFAYFTSIGATNAGTATVLQQTSIIMIMLVCCIRNRKLPNKRESISLILAVVGAFLMATRGNIHELVISRLGLIWGLTNAFAVTVYTIYPVNLIKKYGTSTVTGWAMLLGGISLQIIFKPWTMGVTVDFSVITMVLIIVIFGTILPFSMYLAGVLYAGANKAAMLSNMEPVTAAVLSVVWLGDYFHPMDILGSVLILATIFILGDSSEKLENKEEQKAEIQAQ